MKDLRLLAIGFAACLFVFGVYSVTFDSETSAQRSPVTRWDYAAITGTYAPFVSENSAVSVSAAANICYMQAAGCQNEEVRADVSLTKFFQDTRWENSPTTRTLAFDKAAETAYAKAITKLGLDGWELVSTPGLQFDNYFQNPQGNHTVQEGDKNRKPDLYFKRPRQ
jgi:hypothetical protein